MISAATPLLGSRQVAYSSTGQLMTGRPSTTQHASTSALQDDEGPLRSRSGSGPNRPRQRDQRPRWYTVAFELENKGSVARDHLAAERTYLAYLRTSLALASIGIAITQLFRLPSSTTLSPSNNSTAPAALASLAARMSSEALDSASAPELDLIKTVLLEQAQQLKVLTEQVNDPQKYRHLGKPVGGTFIALALLFLVLGTVRYFMCQSALMREPSMFPPARRSVVFSTFCVAAIVVATFAAILSTR